MRVLKIYLVLFLLLLLGTSVACGHKAPPQPPESLVGKVDFCRGPACRVQSSQTELSG
jgi:hypothetical protein